jgi:hypothetical protein
VIEDKLKNKDIANQAEMDLIVSLLKERTKKTSTNRELFINSLFKALLDASFPSHLKCLFRESTQPDGMFTGPTI